MAGGEGGDAAAVRGEGEMRSLALTPTWSVATVLTLLVVGSLLIERSIHRLSNWLKKTHRNPLYKAMEKMKEEMMLLGFISLLLAATSRIISGICIDSKYYNSKFSPCTKAEVEESLGTEHAVAREGKRLMEVIMQHSLRRNLKASYLHRQGCREGYESFVSHEGLEQLHRFIFVMAFPIIDFGTILYPFLKTHNLAPTYDFHNYMIRSMEEEFEKIVGVSGVLWGFVVAFMLFNIDGSNLYFWIAILPVTLVLVVGAKLQYVIATLTAEGARMTAYGPRIKPRDDLFWFKKPEFLLWLIHFILFQWQFGYDSCFIKNHLLVYGRLILGFAGQFLCSYSTLPVYALVTQMGSKYKAALIPRRIRETIHGWGKATRKKRRRRRHGDDSTIRTETSTVCSLTDEDDDDDDDIHGPFEDTPRASSRPYLKTIELQQHSGHSPRPDTPCFHPIAMPPRSGEGSSHLMLSASAPSSPPSNRGGRVTRSASMPFIASLRTGSGTPTRMNNDST
ncbi:hypothetical protein PR202_ga18554 [Eleusine coracana subsp. coracana]|uniref:MLO-like protein n=1 Tax=Eleusine coracana subsp. coracana TaxID=191504 RepID=A0AAV5CTH1_ELECO|nr:hypothetical protein PR202_ga18554 [Eleusine coracana subsp. coracana]